MLEQLLKLYTTAMLTGQRSPMPHFVGPPGSGKSTVFQQLADLLGVKLHVVNVSRLSPLSLEGLEMPNHDNTKLNLLITELWTKASEGDIYLFDEFLRGFPEVYNGLLDIFTAREVAGFELPNVFIASASNSTATYDSALEDRLLHIPVPDPRKSNRERKRLQQLIVDQIGLHPAMVDHFAMLDLMNTAVLPTFEMLDRFTGKATANSNTVMKGSSVRKIIGQARLRHIELPALRDLLAANNAMALGSHKPQYAIFTDAPPDADVYVESIVAFRNSIRCTPLQAQNIDLNLQIIQMDKAKKDAGPTDEEDIPYANDDDLFG